MKKYTALLFALVSLPALSELHDMDYFVVQALSTFNGEARGELGGNMADFFRQTTKSQSPVTVKAKVVRWYATPACGRVLIKMRQAQVPTTDGRMVPFQNGMEISKCKDGSTPKEFELPKNIPYIPE